MTPTAGSSNRLTRVCVFCGSSPGSEPAFRTAARELGTLLAERGIGLVYGGASVGLMGILADAALAAGAEVIGVLPQHLVSYEIAHEGLTELRLVESMHERKAQMASLADGFVALPGGFGTFEELFEVVTWRQLGLHQKPAVLLNVEGFFDPLVAQMDRMVGLRLLSAENRELLGVATTPAEALDLLAAAAPPAGAKWLDRELT